MNLQDNAPVENKTYTYILFKKVLLLGCDILKKRRIWKLRICTNSEGLVERITVIPIFTSYQLPIKHILTRGLEA